MRASSLLPEPNAAISVMETVPRTAINYWPDRRILDLFGIEVPIVQAPMAGIATADLASAVATAGGLASLPCTLLSPHQMRTEIEAVRHTKRPLNVNFLCHAPAAIDRARDAWRRRLAPYYVELGLDPATPAASVDIPTFGDAQCQQVEELRPDIVSFHFGLPDRRLV